MIREKINLKDTSQEIIVKMAEGNPGGLSVLIDMLKANPLNLLEMLSLDDMNIRGTQIWVGYKDYCGEDLEKFLAAVKSRDPEMVKVINDTCIYDNEFGKFIEVAVTHGASFERPGARAGRL